MKTLLSFILLIIILSLINSCKKGDLFTLESTAYHPEKIENSNLLRAFTKSGEIKNPGILADLMRRDTAELSRAGSLLFYSRDRDTILVINGQNAIVQRANYTISYETENKKRLAKFTAKDSTFKYSFSEVMRKTIEYHIGKFKPVIIDERLGSSTGGNYYFIHKTFQQFFAFPGEDALRAPFIIAIQHRPYYNYEFWVQNILDPIFFKNLSEKDTVSLREVNLVYKK